LPFERQPRPGQPRNAPSHPRPPTSRPGAVPERQPRPGQPRNAPIHPRSPRAALGRSRASAQTRPTTERPEPPTILTSRPGPFAVRRSSEPLPRDALSPPESRPRLPLVEAAKRPRCGATEQPSVSPDQANHGTPRTTHDPHEPPWAVRRSPFKRAASARRARPLPNLALGSRSWKRRSALGVARPNSRASAQTRPTTERPEPPTILTSRPGPFAVSRRRSSEPLPRDALSPPESRPRLPLVEAAKRPGVERPHAFRAVPEHQSRQDPTTERAERSTSPRAALVPSPFQRAASARRARPSRISPSAPARGSGEAPGCGATGVLPLVTRIRPVRWRVRRVFDTDASRTGEIGVPRRRTAPHHPARG
jgi:hypothetical protein